MRRFQQGSGFGKRPAPGLSFINTIKERPGAGLFPKPELCNLLGRLIICCMLGSWFGRQKTLTLFKQSGLMDLTFCFLTTPLSPKALRPLQHVR